MRLKRIIIYPKDVQVLTGKSERYGRGLIQKIRGHLKKQPHQMISIKEFCDYTGLEEEEVRSHII